jgi:uncharacterized protein YcbX
MTALIEMLRQYIDLADYVRLESLRDGSMTVEEAKADVLETEKWREKLAALEAQKEALDSHMKAFG